MVLSQLYDPLTPYARGQEVKLSFPRTSMVTSQDVRHGAGADNVNVRGGVGSFFFDRKDDATAAAAASAIAGNASTNGTTTAYSSSYQSIPLKFAVIDFFTITS